MSTLDDSPTAGDPGRAPADSTPTARTAVAGDAPSPQLLPPARGRAGRCWQRCEQALERIGEHLNPILIKEARQSLKSRQFTVTFALVLAAAWGWSLLGIAWIGPQVYYAANGPGLLYGYVVILLLALVVVVPYSAFRSLAGELEDHTYELLSITSLKARQIIGGKLASSVLQVLVFLSAISPCIAFTYLLRGVDILTIVVLMAHAALASIGLSLAGLLLATCSMDRYRQVVASVLLILALVGLFFFGCALAEQYVVGVASIALESFFMANAVWLTVYVSYFALLYFAAAAQLSFASSNRSTAVRIVMVVQQALFCGWMTYAWLRDGRSAEYLIGVLMIAGAQWYVMGVFLTGEPQRLSPRVKRDLPQSFLGRALLTWFNPGAATGYVFVLSNFLTVCILTLIAVPFCSPGYSAPRVSIGEKVFYLGLLGGCYLAIYLGLGKLAVRAARRSLSEGVPILLRAMIHLLLLAAGSAIPAIIQMSSDTLRHTGYSLLQITNPLWTMTELADPGKAWPTEFDLLRIALPLAASLVLLANLPSVIDEVRQVRVVKPTRVAEEDAALAAKHHPAEAVPSSPWG